MNSRISLATRLAFVTLVLVTLACGASSQAVNTESAKSSELEVAATESPAEAPAKVPDLINARIPLYDLPGGFEELPGEEFDMGFPVSGKELEPQAVFAYVNGGEFQVILGMNFLLTDALDSAGFDFALSQPELTLKEIASSMNGSNVRREEVSKVLDGVGETQIAMTMIADVEDIPMRVNIGMFRRDVVGGMILSMTMLGQPEKVSLRELGQLFDKRILEALKTAE